MGKKNQNFREKRRLYKERLDTKIAYHTEFSGSISDQDLEMIKTNVRIEMEKEYRLQVQKRFLYFIAGFLVLAFTLFYVIH